MPDLQLTNCELEVMDVVWRKGRATVQEVVDALERPLAYTTVMTTLKILDEKRGVVARTKAGRAFVYEPLFTREEVCHSLAGNLTQRLYGGSLKSLVLSLMGTDAMSAADVAELKQAIQSLESAS
jgi:predicted transcriptional regulator